jgi:leucyl-tRNA synthetase
VDKTVLAEEQVDSNMRSWRSGAKVEKKLLQQWFVKTAVFAERLAAGLTSGSLKHGWRDVVDLQKHWIGDIKGYFCDCIVDIKDLKCGTGEDPTVSSKEPVRLWFSNPESLKNARYFIIRPDHFLSETEDCVAEEFKNGMKLMKLQIVNPATNVALPVFTGPTDVLPCVPPSSDIRVDEVLSDSEYGDLATNESALSEIHDILKQLNVSTIL